MSSCSRCLDIQNTIIKKRLKKSVLNEDDIFNRPHIGRCQVFRKKKLLIVINNPLIGNDVFVIPPVDRAIEKLVTTPSQKDPRYQNHADGNRFIDQKTNCFPKKKRKQ